MLAIKDLDFFPHKAGLSGVHAVKMFDNGYGVSVLLGSMFYSNGHTTYEVAILNSDGSIAYDTPITDDVLGHRTIEEVDDIMRQVQELEKI